MKLAIQGFQKLFKQSQESMQQDTMNQIYVESKKKDLS